MSGRLSEDAARRLAPDTFRSGLTKDGKAVAIHVTFREAGEQGLVLMFAVEAVPAIIAQLQDCLPAASSAHGSGPLQIVEQHRTTKTEGGGNVHLDSQSRDWATPRAEDGERGKGSQFAGLSEDVTAWATPTTRDHREKSVKSRRGETQSPSAEPTDPTASSPIKPRARGLNPRFGLWLMGFPVEWLSSVPSATPSSRRGSSRARSAKSPDSKPSPVLLREP